VRLYLVMDLLPPEFAYRFSETFMKKLLGRTDIEDALQRLETVTEEEARMAAAEALKAIHGVGDAVRGIHDAVRDFREMVQGGDDRAKGIGDKAVIGAQKLSNISSLSSTLILLHDIFSVSQLRPEAMDWLSPPDLSLNYYIARDAHHEGTTTWFIESDTFKNWKKSGSLLWIHGKRMFPDGLQLRFRTDFKFHSGIRQKRPYVCHLRNSFRPRFAHVINYN